VLEAAEKRKPARGVNIMADTIHSKSLPGKEVVHAAATEVQIPARAGLAGYSARHAPLITELRLAKIAYRSEGALKRLSVAWGFAEVLPEKSNDPGGNRRTRGRHRRWPAPRRRSSAPRRTATNRPAGNPEAIRGSQAGSARHRCGVERQQLDHRELTRMNAKLNVPGIWCQFPLPLFAFILFFRRSIRVLPFFCPLTSSTSRQQILTLPRKNSQRVLVLVRRG